MTYNSNIVYKMTTFIMIWSVEMPAKQVRKTYKETFIYKSWVNRKVLCLYNGLTRGQTNRTKCIYSKHKLFVLKDF